jgi:NADP-dependent 3-hydroxy acid dehydrogenase YdfG
MAERKKGFGRTALITGASSGMGLELSRLFAANGYNLVVVARSVEKLKALATQLESEHQVRVLACPMDLSQPQAVDVLWSELTNAGVAVDVLVNNAGVGLYGELWEQDADELRRMLVLNVEVLTLLTRYALPGMVERGWGRILNLASLVAYQPGGPRMAAYYGSKAYVLSWGPGLRWGIMGQVLLNHLGGGQGGIEHFFQQFTGPLTAWWKVLGSPTLTPELQQKLIDGVHAEVGSRSVDELAAERDEALLGLLELRTRLVKTAVAPK